MWDGGQNLFLYTVLLFLRQLCLQNIQRLYALFKHGELDYGLLPRIYEQLMLRLQARIGVYRSPHAARESCEKITPSFF
jgi:hypothetical protein